MVESTRALLTGILDYAGTYPPAGLALTESIENYDGVSTSEDRWLLGRLIVPSARLSEFPAQRGAGLNLSVVFGPRPEDHLDEALAFAERQDGDHRVCSFEFPPLGASEIRDLSRSVPNTVEAFFEVPIDRDLERRIHVIATSGALAKVRTGGVTPRAFPSAEELVRFFEACSAAGVGFKATAGLHHAIRGCYPLTYEPGSQTGVMHGFLNVSIAAAIVHIAGDSLEAVDAVLEPAAETFEFATVGLVWRGQTIPNSDLAATRRLFFRSFGSCSVREPLDDLARLQLL